MLSKYVADESDLEIRNILPWNCVCRRIYDWTYYSVFKKNVTDEYTRAKLKKKKNNSLFTEILLIDAINLHLHFTLIKCIKERLYIKKNITHIQSKFPFFLNNN